MSWSVPDPGVPQTWAQELTSSPIPGYAALHELFHIDPMAHGVAYNVQHVYDRKICI
jgi:hypothetical protein